MLIGFADSEQPMIFTKINDSYLPEPISIENPCYVDCKYVIFSLAQIRAYILRDVKRDRTIGSDFKLHILLIIFAYLPW